MEELTCSHSFLVSYLVSVGFPRCISIHRHVRVFGMTPGLPLLFWRAPIARSVNQTSFGHFSLALRVNLETQFGICVTDLAIGAPHV